MSDEENKKKEVLIRRHQIISFDSEGVYRNGVKVEESNGAEKNYEERAKSRNTKLL